MKKFISLILAIVVSLSCFGMVASAKVGDVIGTALHTDIVVYINNFAVPSYAVNGQSVIVAEDLRNFGFDVVWNQYNRSLTITRNSQTDVTPMYVGKGYATGAKFTNILETDIGVWAAGTKLTSYAMNGYTMIPVEELTMFGEVYWVQEERALKMWVDDLYINADKQVVSYRYYTGSSAPDFGWITETVCVLWEDESNGDKVRFYAADYSDMQEYVNYIKKNGWYLDKEAEVDGIFFSGYINKKLRVGIAVAQYEDMIIVQLANNIDYWI